MSDILITDWSNIAFEFAFCTLRPCIFVNTPMKVLNPNYMQYGLDVPLINLRSQIGVSIEMVDITQISEVVERMLGEKEGYRDRIGQLVREYVYHPGRSGEAGGKYIISRLRQKNAGGTQ
jgi:YidC/Oxa1 family membrane protein insertase